MKTFEKEKVKIKIKFPLTFPKMNISEIVCLTPIYPK